VQDDVSSSRRHGVSVAGARHDTNQQSSFTPSSRGNVERGAVLHNGLLKHGCNTGAHVEEQRLLWTSENTADQRLVGSRWPRRL